MACRREGRCRGGRRYGGSGSGPAAVEIRRGDKAVAVDVARQHVEVKRKSPPAVPSPEGKASAPSAHSPSRKFPCRRDDSVAAAGQHEGVAVVAQGGADGQRPDGGAVLRVVAEVGEADRRAVAAQQGQVALLHPHVHVEPDADLVEVDPRQFIELLGVRRGRGSQRWNLPGPPAPPRLGIAGPSRCR